MRTLSDGLAYAVHELRRHGRDPEWWRKRVIHRINGPVQQRLLGYDGVDIMSADWDVLVVLDACRADLFEATVSTDRYDDYRRVTSRASMTTEWTKRNFRGGAFGDTVYVTANPLVSKHAPDCWHRRIDVWRDGFDDEVGTVPPEPVTEAALDARETHPNKRLVVHYVQPHAPFLTRPELRFLRFDGGHHGGGSPGTDGGPKNVWDALGRGLVPREEVMAGYRENLDCGLAAFDRLSAAFEGRIILTADHGNLFGQWTWPVPFRVYGHPALLRHRGLTRVPWAVVETGRRPTITDDGVRADAATDDEMHEQLAALGYK